jgi:hypothetical protein
MDEIVIRMVGSKLVLEVALAHVLEVVAGKGALSFEVTSAQIIQAVRDAGAKPSAAQPGAKPGPKSGPKLAAPATTT